MKYIRKIASLIITVVIIASVAIGVGMIFAVRNVNITLQSYLYDSKEAENEISEYKSVILGELRGKIIAFVNPEDVENAIEGSKYSLVSFEKLYPCTLNVEICERKEKYVIEDDGRYLIYDDNGAYLRTANTQEEAYNPLDNAPNVVITGAVTGEEIELVADLGELFNDNFAPLRSTVESITFKKSGSQSDSSRVIFNLRCGICIEIQNCEVRASEKISKAYACFTHLSGEEKLSGKIYAVVTNDIVDATYNGNG